ncbi:MAG: hypothetical protein V3R57_02320, partial [Candidatus Bathyarchaeia archaeon]
HDNPDNLFKFMDALWQLGFNVKLEITKCDIKMTITIREANTYRVPKAVGRRVQRSPQRRLVSAVEKRVSGIKIRKYK